MALAEQPSPVKVLEQHSDRLKEIVGVAVRYGLTEWINPIGIPGVQEILNLAADKGLLEKPIEVRLRLALTELGTTFIKAGQVLSTRVDLIGPKMADELSNLQSNTPPDPPEVVVRAVERELGHPIGDIYAEFDPNAFASASVGQVHRAMLPSGELVAVKVQRQGVEAKVYSDLAILDALAQIGENQSETLENWGVVRLVKEFSRTILNDLDFRRDMQNNETFRENFADDETVYFPRIWSELTTRRVMTSEYLPGIIGTDEEALKLSGIDLNAFAQRGARVFLNMIFRDSFYHADPHPGNLMLLPGGVVGIIDCGMVGRIDEGLRYDLETLVAAITDGDADSLANALMSQSAEPANMTEDDLKADLTDLLAESGGSLDEIDVGATLNGMFAIFRKYQIRLRPGLSSLLRTLALLDGTSRRLSPQFSLKSILKPFQDEAIRRRLTPGGLMKRLRSGIVGWDRFLETLPRELTTSLQKIRTGEIKVQLEHRHLDSVVNRLVLGILTASLILGASMLWSSKAPPTIQGHSLLGAAGYCIAIILGFVLYRAIKDSGKIAPDDD